MSEFPGDLSSALRSSFEQDFNRKPGKESILAPLPLRDGFKEPRHDGMDEFTHKSVLTRPKVH